VAARNRVIPIKRSPPLHEIHQLHARTARLHGAGWRERVVVSSVSTVPALGTSPLAAKPQSVESAARLNKVEKMKLDKDGLDALPDI
jgi:hypothetical protein